MAKSPAPEFVEGTLAKGFEIYRSIAAPLHGNGRTARLMMNAELVAAGESRIIVPAVYRNNYLVALKALSQNGIPGALLRMLDFAQRYTAAVDFSKLERARFILDRTHAFADPSEAIPATAAWCCLRPPSWPMPRNSNGRYRYRTVSSGGDPPGLTSAAGATPPPSAVRG